MECSLLFSGDFFVALTATALCCLFAVALFSFRSKSRKQSKSESKASVCSCSCKANGGVETAAYLNGGGSFGPGGSGGGKEMVESGPVALAAAERLTGASMMEQLVPEITTHALSYLDYPSLCRLSMTNSLMRKAANDDNAWKALYHKVQFPDLLTALFFFEALYLDFTLEQDSVTPVNGWKAYYAATRAIMNTNAEFFKIIKEKSVPAMGRFWLKADYVKCFHANGEFFTGYNAVMESWQGAFNWEQSADFQIRDVRIRVFPDSAWVTMKAYLQHPARPFHMTNVFESHNGRWYMVHHHCSIMLLHGGPEQQIVQG
nr:F-box protein SKIP8-like isoform X1 [Ipomoea trifida]